jgi:small GTP-binding protein
MEDSPSFGGRVVLIGNAAVGKTSLFSRLIDNSFDEFERQTTGAQWRPFTYEADLGRIELQIWDTAGQEKFRSLGPLYYRKAAGAVAVFDITKSQSFDDLDTWISAFVEIAGTEATIFVAGNKADLEKDRQVCATVAAEWARDKGAQFYETSAKTGLNVREMFEKLAVALSRARNLTTNAEDNLIPTKKTESSCC